MAELEVVVVTKAQLRKALEDSGLSYEQPPDLDAERVWDELRRITQIVLVTLED